MTGRRTRTWFVLLCGVLLTRATAQDEEQSHANCVSCRYNTKPEELNVEHEENVFDRTEHCTPDLNGLFGSDDLGNEEYVEFFYQVETEPLAGGMDEVNDEIVGPVETSITRTILPELFAVDCAPVGRSGHRRLEVGGVSSLPADRVLEGVSCQGAMMDEANDCYVIDGNMTLFSSSELDSTFLDGIRPLIQRAMDGGAYNDVDPRIVMVSYVDISSLQTTSVDGADTQTRSTEGGSLPAYALVIVGIGALFVLVGTLVLLRKRHRENQEARGLGGFPTEDDDDLL